MKIRYEEQTGWPGALKLIRRVAAFGRIDRVLGFKVGITSDPEKRASGYRYNDPHFKEMVVIYKTSSDAVVRDIKGKLTDWFLEDNECHNERRGGGGPSGKPPYYLYVVLCEQVELERK